MLVESIILGIIIGFLRGGSLRKLENLKLRGLYLVILAFIIKASLSFILINHAGCLNEVHSFILTILQYLLLFIFVFINSKYPFMLLSASGFLLNFIAIVSNQGSMPLSQRIVNLSTRNSKIEMIKANKFYTYRLIDSKTKLWFLGDVIKMTFPIKRFISLGDIILALGIMLLIQEVMVNPPKKNRDRESS